uniref:NADH-ubiquinone oxidoreductase chain 2 n=1 Tax=Austrolebias charrua TaxID=308057 RepID=A0A0R7A1Y1_9TELE|nr:NADH dehydrogenase subunit 2 [Austrolebias charrua]AKL82653.1 NADH dehydrogenase subunit 2 [Austrolebias charrua]
MSPYMMLMLLSTLIIGTLITLSSSHWLLAWVGLEINTFAIIPLMTQNPHPRALEATLKYFVVQATAAIMLLFSSTLNAWLSGQWDIKHMVHPIPLAIIIIALSLKMGLAPVHAWFPEVLQGLDFKVGLVLSTWQKLAPLILFSQISYEYSPLYIILGLTSILIGGWGGLNQTQLRKILAYSSIAHLGWVILVTHYFPAFVLLAFYIYTILTFVLFFTFHYMYTTSMNSLSTSWAKTPFLMTTTPLTLLSLGGLPPFTGFISKWVILNELTKQGLILMATIAALSALLSLFFYLRLSYAMTLTMPPNNLPAMLPWRLPFLFTPLLLTTSIVASFGLLPLSPSLLAFFLL